MNIIYLGLDDLPLNTNEYAVCLGVFDGVHKGHRALIEKTVKRAKELSVKSAVAAFFPEETGNRIYLFEQMAEILELLSVDTMFAIPLKEDFKKLSCNAFVEKYLIDYIHAKHIVCGDDYTFGINKSGNADTIAEFSKKYGYGYDIIGEIRLDDERVSSTRIRELLKEGNIKKASLMLGESYHIDGCVKKGYELGRTLGFPTVNIELNKELSAIKKGVYSSAVNINGKEYKAITNIGTAPTAGKDKQPVTETYIIGFDGILYNKYLRVRLTDFLREEKKFESMEELKEAISENVRMLIN